MKRYRVAAEMTISVSTVVEAKTRAEAIKKAQERPVVRLCYQCARGAAETEWVTSGELDGEPQRLVADLEAQFI